MYMYPVLYTILYTILYTMIIPLTIYAKRNQNDSNEDIFTKGFVTISLLVWSH